MYLTLEENKRQGFIMVPKSSSLYRMRRNEKMFGWLDNILDALDEKTSHVESAKNLLMHIGSLKQYRDVFAEVVEELGLTTIPRLDEATSFAIHPVFIILSCFLLIMILVYLLSHRCVNPATLVSFCFIHPLRPAVNTGGGIYSL